MRSYDEWADVRYVADAARKKKTPLAHSETQRKLRVQTFQRLDRREKKQARRLALEWNY